MDEIYEVERDQYAGLIGEMKTSCFHMDTSYQEDKTIITLTSKATGKLITKRIIDADGNETYFIYDLPENSERLAPKKIRKYELQTKEEVQAFFDFLAKKIKEENKND